MLFPYIKTFSLGSLVTQYHRNSIIISMAGWVYTIHIGQQPHFSPTSRCLFGWLTSRWHRNKFMRAGVKQDILGMQAHFFDWMWEWIHGIKLLAQSQWIFAAKTCNPSGLESIRHLESSHWLERRNRLFISQRRRLGSFFFDMTTGRQKKSSR